MAALGDVRLAAGSRPFVAGGIDLEAVLGKYFDEVGVALEWIVAQVWDSQTAPVDEGECQKVAGCRDVWFNRVASRSGGGV